MFRIVWRGISMSVVSSQMANVIYPERRHWLVNGIVDNDITVAVKAGN
jgi:hypothetical protein